MPQQSKAEIILDSRTSAELTNYYMPPAMTADTHAKSTRSGLGGMRGRGGLDASPVQGATPGEVGMRLPLTDKEKRQLEQSEEVLRTGLRTFFEVGSALLTIQRGKLYRATHATFESYCHDRWQIGRSYASRVMGAAERIKLLPAKPSLPKPTNEFQIRPFLRLEPKMFPRAWEKTIRRAKDEKLTPRLIREVITEIAPNKVPHRRATTSSGSARSLGPFSISEVLALLTEARQRVERHETHEALEALEKIEWALFGTQRSTPRLQA